MSIVMRPTDTTTTCKTTKYAAVTALSHVATTTTQINKEIILAGARFEGPNKHLRLVSRQIESENMFT